MNKSNRDLLVLFNQELMSPQALEQEVHKLHELLHNIEKTNTIIIAHEIIDLKKYKIIKNPSALCKVLRQKELKPFIFLSNKN